MKPSDPDFPYDIEELECALEVPSQYPTSQATLSVRNKDIPRGFQINIEKGFDTIAGNAPGATLLTVMNRLDNQLETILSGKMAETIKIVQNKSSTQRSTGQTETMQASAPTLESQPGAKAKTTDLQRDQARVKRQSDMRQLEARFGRLESYAKSSDEMTYTLPLDSPKRSSWPLQLQSLRTLQLTVPELYPLEPAKLKLDSESEEARAVEVAFNKRATTDSTLTLTQQANYLSQNLKTMATTEKHSEPVQTLPIRNTSPNEALPAKEAATDQDKSHIQYIARPPEWDRVATTDSEDDTSADESESDAQEDKVDGENPEEGNATASTAPAERGILLSFPHLELHGIELLELTSLNITVKCERCKDTTDIERLRNATEDTKEREVSCKKCALTFGIRFRADLIHANSVRGGYVDLDNCTVVDMLPR